jgi:hypothetical protein
MKTISTKLDKKTAEAFLKVCNDEGKCQSEMLRDLIENICELEENESNQDLEVLVEDVDEQRMQSVGKIVGVTPSEVTNVRIIDV